RESRTPSPGGGGEGPRGPPSRRAPLLETAWAGTGRRRRSRFPSAATAPGSPIGQLTEPLPEDVAVGRPDEHVVAADRHPDGPGRVGDDAERRELAPQLGEVGGRVDAPCPVVGGVQSGAPRYPLMVTRASVMRSDSAMGCRQEVKYQERVSSASCGRQVMVSAETPLGAQQLRAVEVAFRTTSPPATWWVTKPCALRCISSAFRRTYDSTAGDSCSGAVTASSSRTRRGRSARRAASGHRREATVLPRPAPALPSGSR